MNKLKPCPFCGSKEVNATTPPQKHPDMDAAMYWVCPECVACGPIGATLEEATDNWNKRSD